MCAPAVVKCNSLVHNLYSCQHCAIAHHHSRIHINIPPPSASCVPRVFLERRRKEEFAVWLVEEDGGGTIHTIYVQDHTTFEKYL